LVDRIVTDKPKTELLPSIGKEPDYEDHVLIMAEDYGSWVIEGDEHIKEALSFARVDDRILIEPDINFYCELKLRLLNGTHTLGCGPAFLAGCETVKDAMNDKIISSFITEVMQKEIAPSIPYQIDLETAQQFGSKVLERFRNPYIQHSWLDIAWNYSSKMKLRCVPVLVKHYEHTDGVPEAMALGFAAYIYFMKPVAKKGNQYFGERKGESYLIQDDQAELFYKRWAGLSTTSLVQVVLTDAFWGADLLSLPGFKQSVIEKLNLIIHNGMKEAIESIPLKKVKAA